MITTRQIAIAAIAGAIVLFLFDGAFQAIPGLGVSAVEPLETQDLTTAYFPELANRMAYIITDKTVTFAATKEAAYYNMGRFLAVEFASAFVVSLLFALFFSKVENRGLSDRMVLTVMAAIIATFAIHIPYFNWWGFSFAYTLGVAARTVLGWSLLAFIQNRFIFKVK